MSHRFFAKNNSKSTLPLVTLAVMWSVLSRSTTRAFVPSLRSRPYAIFPSTARSLLYSTTSSVELEELNNKIQQKGEEIRKLKADGISKDDLAPHVEELLALKAQLPADENEKPKKEKKKKEEPQQKKKPVANKQQPAEELSESELRLNRLAKVQAMKEAGVEPFEYSFVTTHTSAELFSLYDGKLEPGEEDESADVRVAGRIMTRRVFGKLAFFTLQDETGTIQLQFDKSRLGDAFTVRVVDMMLWRQDMTRSLTHFGALQPLYVASKRLD